MHYDPVMSNDRYQPAAGPDGKCWLAPQVIDGWVAQLTRSARDLDLLFRDPTQIRPGVPEFGPRIVAAREGGFEGVRIDVEGDQFAGAQVRAKVVVRVNREVLAGCDRVCDRMVLPLVADRAFVVGVQGDKGHAHLGIAKGKICCIHGWFRVVP